MISLLQRPAARITIPLKCNLCRWQSCFCRLLKLGKWQLNQRTKYKASTLSQHKIRQIGVPWGDVEVQRWAIFKFKIKRKGEKFLEKYLRKVKDVQQKGFMEITLYHSGSLTIINHIIGFFNPSSHSGFLNGRNEPADLRHTWGKKEKITWQNSLCLGVWKTTWFWFSMDNPVWKCEWHSKHSNIRQGPVGSADTFTSWKSQN